jgi:hypothetical protein
VVCLVAGILADLAASSVILVAVVSPHQCFVSVIRCLAVPIDAEKTMCCRDLIDGSGNLRQCSKG